MRIIAGTYRSRILKSLKGQALRATSDRLRETLFNVLGAGISNSRFLDIFAGTGAVGIEALSRGASHATFIENHAPSATLIRKNLASLKINSGITIIRADALCALETLEAKINSDAPGYDYIFVDPPYAAVADYSHVVQYLGASRLLDNNGILIVEHRKTFSLPDSVGSLGRLRLLRQGDAALSFYRHHHATENPPPDPDNP
jgi:16S rRNA (guanine966-N2)-methyltransferase